MTNTFTFCYILTSMTLGKLLILSVPWFPHMYPRVSNISSLVELVRVLKKLIYMEHLEKGLAGSMCYAVFSVTEYIFQSVQHSM